MGSPINITKLYKNALFVKVNFLPSINHCYKFDVVINV